MYNLQNISNLSSLMKKSQTFFFCKNIYSFIVLNKSHLFFISIRRCECNRRPNYLHALHRFCLINEAIVNNGMSQNKSYRQYSTNEKLFWNIIEFSLKLDECLLMSTWRLGWGHCIFFRFNLQCAANGPVESFS